jgi:16S rRNA (cytidine1402-2'-O)-methyltransferase
VRRDTLENLAAHYEKDGAPKGEIVIVIGPPGEKTFSDEELERLLRRALEDLSVKDAAAKVAEKTGLSKKTLYEMALTLK